MEQQTIAKGAPNNALQPTGYTRAYAWSLCPLLVIPVHAGTQWMQRNGFRHAPE